MSRLKKLMVLLMGPVKMIDSWNSAARAAVNLIFSKISDGGSTDIMREIIEQMVDNYNDDPSYSTSGSHFVIEDWTRLGAAALSTGRDLQIFPVSDFSEEVAAILARKQNDYGSYNISRFGLYGLLVRMHDKIARIENLTSKGINPENESLRDNYTDVIGYAAIGIMLEQGTFLLPLVTPTVAESN